MTMQFGLPPKQGLYDPLNEHDACGIGFVANINGNATHKIVEQGVEVLVNLTHRGACGCDPETGDGAGLLLQLPHEFFVNKAQALGFAVPDLGEYGVGMVSSRAQEDDRRAAQQMVEEIVEREGQKVLGWREVPTNARAIGWLARESEPSTCRYSSARAPASP